MAERHARDARKALLIAELAHARAALTGSVREAQGELGAVRSAASRKGLWLGAAAAGGWLLARFSGGKSRKAKSRVARAVEKPAGPVERTGWLLALLGTLGTLLRPAITRYLTHQLTDYFSRAASHEPRSRQPSRSLRR